MSLPGAARSPAHGGGRRGCSSSRRPLSFAAEPRRLRIAGTIDAAMADYVERTIRAAWARPLHVVINSAGGSLSAAKRIYGELRAHRMPIVTAEAVGQASSGAALALLAAGRRQIMYGSTIMLHAPSFPAGHTPSSDDERFLDMERMRMGISVSCRTGRSLETVLDWMDHEATFSAYQAEACGLVHEVTR